MNLPTCDWCQYEFEPNRLVGVELNLEPDNDEKRLCPGCYYCWKFGAPGQSACEPLVEKTKEE